MFQFRSKIIFTFVCYEISDYQFSPILSFFLLYVVDVANYHDDDSDKYLA